MHSSTSVPLSFPGGDGRMPCGSKISSGHAFPADGDSVQAHTELARAVQRPRVIERPLPAVTILSTGIYPKLRRKVEKAAGEGEVLVEYVEPRPDAGIFDIIDDLHKRKRMASIVILDGHGCAEGEDHLIQEDRGVDPVTGRDLIAELATEQVIDRICHGARSDGEPQWSGLLIVQTCEGYVMRDRFTRMRSPVLHYGEQRRIRGAAVNAGTQELIARIGQAARFRGAFSPYPETVFKWISRVSGETVELVRGNRESLVSNTAAPEDIEENLNEKKIAQAFAVRIAYGTCAEAARFLDIWPDLLGKALEGKRYAMDIALERQDNEAMLQFLAKRGALKSTTLCELIPYAEQAGLLLSHIEQTLEEELVARVRNMIRNESVSDMSRIVEMVLDVGADMLLDLMYSAAPHAQLAYLAIWRGVRGFAPDSRPGIYEQLFTSMARICSEKTDIESSRMESLLGRECTEVDVSEMREFVSPATLARMVDMALARGADGLTWLQSGPIEALHDLAYSEVMDDPQECRRQAEQILCRYQAPNAQDASTTALNRPLG